MSRLLVLAPLLLLLATGCNGDDDGNGDGGTPTVGVRETPVENGDGDGPSGDGLKTPSDETPAEAETPAPIDTGATPAATGIRAVLLEDPAAFLQQEYPGESPEEAECQYNPVTVLVTCPGFDDYAIDPPILGQDVSCAVGTVDGAPVYIRCTSQEPLQSIYYRVVDEG